MKSHRNKTVSEERRYNMMAFLRLGSVIKANDGTNNLVLVSFSEATYKSVRLMKALHVSW